MKIKLPVEANRKTEQSYVLIFETIYGNFKYRFFDVTKLKDTVYHVISNEAYLSVCLNNMLKDNYLQKIKYENGRYIKNIREHKTVRLNKEVKYKDIMELKTTSLLNKFIYDN